MSDLPARVAGLFWELAPDELEPLRHPDYVMARVMSRGGWDAMCWLRATFPAAALAEFLVRKGDQLSPRDRAYWSLVSGADLDIPQGGSRPPWAGP